jgi:hypothetical protein
MQTKIVKPLKPKKPLKQANTPASVIDSRVEQEDGFEKSRPLSRKEIAELKDQLEDLNRSNTLGG